MWAPAVNRVCNGKKDERNLLASEMDMERNRFHYMPRGKPEEGTYSPEFFVGVQGAAYF